MKKIEKKRLSGAHIAMIALAGSFVLLLLAYFIITAVASSLKDKNQTSTPPDVREEIGEAVYLNSAIAYPQLTEREILTIDVENKTGRYAFIRDGKGTFWLWYTGADGEEEMVPYLPPVLDAERDYSYDELYALEENDGYGTIYKLSYLCSALGTPYFTTRIDLPSGTDAESLAKKQIMLEKYGFGEDEERVSFLWNKKDNKGNVTSEGAHHITIGGRALNGSGYYYMVDGRNCIYYTSSNYFDYALAGFHSFVNGMLVSKGLAEDSSYGPMLTTDFKEWVNTVYKETTDVVVEGANIIARGDVITPIKQTLEYTPDDGSLGYERREDRALEFDLAKFKSNLNYQRMKNLLVGKNVGEYTNDELMLTLVSEFYESSNMIIDYEGAKKVTYTYTITEIEAITNYPSGSGVIENSTPGTSIGSTSTIRIKYTYKVDGAAVGGEVVDVISVASSDLPSTVRNALRSAKVGVLAEPISFDVAHSVKDYEYTITEIEAILTDEAEITATGSTVGTNNLIRISYNYRIDGVLQNTASRHAVLDLSVAGVPAAAVDALRASSVGALSSPVTFTVRYTNTSSPMKHDFTRASTTKDSLVLSSIVAIYDKNGASINAVTEESFVTIRYYQEINGEKQEVISRTIYMEDIKKDEKWGSLYDVLLGKKTTAGMDIAFYEFVSDYELMRDFNIYDINNIRWFITSELVVSFKFANASERDPYYGESFFENTMDSEYQLYGLNANIAESVVKVLGGIGDTTTQADGLKGNTVAVGLTHDVMLKYNLYDYKIFFEVPRGIYDLNEAEGTATEDDLSDYAWHSTLKFNLYVSREDPVTGKRYVASDMYDLVAEVDADKFEFLDYSFTEFWARKYVFLMDVINIDTYEIDFNMKDVYGKYTFDIESKYVYVGRDENNKLVVHEEYKEGISVSKSPQLKFWVDVTQHEGAMQNTELAKLLNKLGISDGKISVSELYNEVMGGGKDLYLPHNSIETVGVSNFMLSVRVLENMMYTGTLTEEEQAAALTTEKLMSIKIKVKGENASPYYYVYEFYRATDRKIMVRLYQVDGEGLIKTAPVSDYYLSTAAFKRVVYGYISLFNAKDIDFEIPYPDELGVG